MKWNDLMNGIIKNAGVAGVKELEDALAELESIAKQPWQKALLRMTGAAVEKYGPVGLERIENLISDLSKGKEPDLGFASLRDRSDYLAALQNMEADDKSKAKDFVRVVGKQVGIILRAILEGLAG